MDAGLNFTPSLPGENDLNHGIGEIESSGSALCSYIWLNGFNHHL